MRSGIGTFVSCWMNIWASHIVCQNSASRQAALYPPFTVNTYHLEVFHIVFMCNYTNSLWNLSSFTEQNMGNWRPQEKFSLCKIRPLAISAEPKSTFQYWNPWLHGLVYSINKTKIRSFKTFFSYTRCKW